MIVLFLLILALAGAAHAQDNPDSDEIVMEWVETLRAYGYPPEPGPISREKLELQRKILKAPLETLPPEIRTGVAMRQMQIFRHNGDWSAFKRLEERVVSAREWSRHTLDAVIMRRIASYYTSNPFPPRARIAGESREAFDSITLMYWEKNIYDSSAAMSIYWAIVDQFDLRYLEAGEVLCYLVYREGNRGEFEKVKELASRNGLPDFEEFYALDYYTEWGVLWTAEFRLNKKRPATERLIRNAREWADWAEGKRATKPDDPWYNPNLVSTATTGTLGIESYVRPTPTATGVLKPSPFVRPAAFQGEESPNEQSQETARRSLAYGGAGIALLVLVFYVVFFLRRTVADPKR